MENTEHAELAPVVLFAYNRPEHTKRTIETLKKNTGADRTDLYIYCDYARDDRALAPMLATREYLRKVDGFRSIHMVERTENYGLAKSVITGVTEVLQTEEKVIVMEDDLITSRFFLEYMNAALDKYKDEERFFSVTGYSHFKDGNRRLPQSYFLKVFSSWSWGIWRDRWEKFDENALGWENIKTDAGLAQEFDYDRCLDNCCNLLAQMETQTIDSWAIRAYWTMFRMDGVTLFPNKRLCENIGNDGSGVHCGADNGYEMTVPEDYRVCEFPDSAKELPESRKLFKTEKRKQKKRYKLGRMKFYLMHPAQAYRKIRRGTR